jgi:hypothetical protein
LACMPEPFQSVSPSGLQFPAGGRAAWGGRRDDAKRAQDIVEPPVAKVAYGGAWYHDEAVRTERAGKN